MPALVGAVAGKTLPQMAATVVYATLADGVKSGDYLRNVNVTRPVGPAADAANGPLLWELSAKALGAAPQAVTMS